VRALPAHVMVEAYSVVTRLPGGLAVPTADAARTLEARFGAAPLRLNARERRGLLSTLADVGVHGGASYDALVALEAHAHGLTLLTLDERAKHTYARLGIKYRAL
jgi:toxin FitB